MYMNTSRPHPSIFSTLFPPQSSNHKSIYKGDHPRPPTPPSLLDRSHLQSRLSVLDQILKVGLVPRTSLRGWCERIRHTTEAVVTGSGRVRSTIRLTTRLDPDKGINKRVASGTSRADTETSALDVAPVAPLLAETSDAVAASVDDGLAGHAGGLELGREESDELLLVLGLIPLGIGGLGELAGGKVV